MKTNKATGHNNITPEILKTFFFISETDITYYIKLFYLPSNIS